MKYLLLLSFLLQGCTSTFVGVAYHLPIDKPEYIASNPMFIFRGEEKLGEATVFFEHISSIPDKEKGYGLNLLGAGIKF